MNKKEFKKMMKRVECVKVKGRKEYIAAAFPSIRVFRYGKDVIIQQGAPPRPGSKQIKLNLDDVTSLEFYGRYKAFVAHLVWDGKIGSDRYHGMRSNLSSGGGRVKGGPSRMSILNWAPATGRQLIERIH